MPERSGALSPHEIAIYLKPAVRKYVLARLADPQKRLVDAQSRQLFDLIEQGLRGRKLVAVVNDYDPKRLEPLQRVRLQVLVPAGKPVDINTTTHAHLTGPLHRCYVQEMCAWVDWYRSRLGMSTRAALAQFRRHYDVSEDDHAFLAAERLYHTHVQATGQSRRKQSVRKRSRQGRAPSPRWPHRA